MAMSPRKPRVTGNGFAMRGEVRRVARAIPDVSIGGKTRGIVGEGNATISVDRGTASKRVLFDARLGEATSIGDNKWEYAWVEVVKATAGHDGWEVRSDGRTSENHGPALNRMEGINGATGLQGNGVTLPVSGATVSLVPIPPNLVVLMEQRTLADGKLREYLFAAPNGIEVVCGNGGGE